MPFEDTKVLPECLDVSDQMPRGVVDGAGIWS
jgi:hypothetical protein